MKSKEISSSRSTFVGREEEFRTIQDAHSRTAARERRRPEVITVSGPAGEGKSFFVSNAVERIAGLGGDERRRRRSRVIAGKCHRVVGTAPFSCVSDALSKFCRDHPLEKAKEEEDEDAEMMTRQFLEDADGDEWILTEVFPCLQNVLGKQQQRSRDLSGMERLVRMKAVLRLLVRVIAAHSSSLTLHFDDLQWVDEASLDLIRSLITDKKLTGCLFICSFRNNDDCAAHNDLTDFFQSLQKEQIPISHITIGPLSIVDISTIIATQRSVSMEEAAALAQFIQNHTGGHAYYVTRLFDYLQHKGFVASCPNGAKLQWDCGAVQKSHLPRTFGDMIQDQIQSLTFNLRDFLARVAAIGFYFDDFTMNLVISQCRINDSLDQIPSFKLRDTIASLLDEAKQLGYITKLGNIGHQFIHDSLYVSAYNVLPQDARDSLHLQIGRVLLKNAGFKRKTSPQSSPSPPPHSGNGSRLAWSINISSDDISGFITRHLFVIVDQLNRGKNSITDTTEKSDLIDFNLRAAKMRMLLSSWELACSYLQTGIGLLEQDHWNIQYQQSIQLYTALSEAAYAQGDYETMNQSIQLILKYGRSIDDKYESYRTFIKYLKMKRENDRVLQLVESVVNQLGVRVKWNKLSKTDDFMFVNKLKCLLKKHTVESISNLPKLEDEKKIKAMNMLIDAGSIAWGTNLFMNFNGAIVKCSIKYGVCDASPPAFLYLSIANFMTEKNQIFAQAALNLVERVVGNDKIKLLVTNQAHGFFQHLTTPVDLSLGPLWRAHRLGVKTGHLEDSMNCGTLCLSYSYYAGEKLHEVDSKSHAVLDWMVEYDIPTSMQLVALIYVQVSKCLSGKSSCPYSLNGDAFNLEEAQGYAKDNVMVSSSLVVCRLELFCLFHQYHEASKLLSSAPDVRDLRKNHFGGVRYTYYECYASIIIAHTTGNKLWKKRARSSLELLEKWVKKGNVNCEHLIPFLQAEMNVMSGNKKEAERLFSKLIEMNDNDADTFLQDKAFSIEKAGLFFKDLGMKALAKECLVRSVNLYRKWGAKAKAHHLDMLVKKWHC